MSTTTYNSGSGNFTVPTGVTSVQIEVWGAGGGGGGGGAGSGDNGGSGGGGGGYCKKNALTVTPGQTISYVVGTGGAGGNDEVNGTVGGNSSAYSGAYVANGGAGGLEGEANNSTATAGGTASGGDVNTTGGTSTVPVGDAGGAGGTGAGSGGAGGGGGAVSVNGTAGTAPGGGGGGGGDGAFGGTGANGRVTFTYTVAGNEYTETPTGGVVAGGSASINADYNIESTGEGIVVGGDATIIDGFYYEMDGGILFGGDSEETDVITMDGGISFAGEAFVDPFVMSGGIRFGGVGSNDFNYTPTGGYRFGGGATIVADRYWDMSGGMKYGGFATTANNGEEVPEGGILFGASEDELPVYGMEFIESPTGEGFAIGGDSEDSMMVGTDGDTLLIGGEAEIVFEYNHTMEGGLIYGDGLFSNGKKYRIKWSVPFDAVEADISNFLLMLAIDLPRIINENEIRVEDIAGNEIKHQTIDLVEDRVVVAVRRDLSTSVDTEGYVFYGV